MYGPCRWGYLFRYCPVDKAIWVRIGPVENSAVAALGIPLDTRTILEEFIFHIITLRKAVWFSPSNLSTEHPLTQVRESLYLILSSVSANLSTYLPNCFAARGPFLSQNLAFQFELWEIISECLAELLLLFKMILEYVTFPGQIKPTIINKWVSVYP